MARYVANPGSTIIEADSIDFEGPWVIFRQYDPIDGVYAVVEAVHVASQDVLIIKELRE